MQKLHELYKDELYILAFPSNDFLSQEPGSNKEIKKALSLAGSFDKKIFTGIATHDPLLIEKSLEIIKQNNINKSMFEFQMLHGVPMNMHIKNISKCGYNVRIYVPFGQNWYDYSIRRIKENPNISKYIIQNLFKK